MYFNQGINWVQGEAAAKSWYVPAGQTALLMDSEEQKFYLKTADASGIPFQGCVNARYIRVTTTIATDMKKVPDLGTFLVSWYPVRKFTSPKVPMFSAKASSNIL